MGSLFSFRSIYLSIFLSCAAALATAYYMQYVMGLEPCSLCMLQRFAVLVIGLIALAAGLHHPGKVGQFLYIAFTGIAVIAGGALSGRQLFLQSLPKDQVPACGPGFEYLMDAFPIFEALREIISGSGECAEVVWRFLGLSIPGWTLVFFIFIAIAMLIPLFKKSPPGAV